MIAQEYAPLARRTLKELPTFRAHMIHMGLGITGEFGELIDMVKKVLVYGKSYDHVHATEEAGDALWYVANLLPELQVEPVYMQRALDRGEQQGIVLQQKHAPWDDFNAGEILLHLNKIVADKSAALPLLHPDHAPGSSAVVEVIEILAGNIAVVCGLIGVSPARAMQVNIEKLAKRYGDKYSDVAALNRDLGAERQVLEGGA